MGEITCLIDRLNAGDPTAGDELFSHVYEELKAMAQKHLSHEPGVISVDSTALVHEVYLRIAGDSNRQVWESRRHFFGAMSQAMRRILIERARAKLTDKRGGN